MHDAPSLFACYQEYFPLSLFTLLRATLASVARHSYPASILKMDARCLFVTSATLLATTRYQTTQSSVCIDCETPQV